MALYQYSESIFWYTLFQAIIKSKTHPRDEVNTAIKEFDAQYGKGWQQSGKKNCFCLFASATVLLPKLFFNNFDLNWKYIMKDKTDREFLEYIHNKMLWKIVSRKEFNNWINKTDNGLTWEEALQDFTSSSIFHLRVENVINSVVGKSQK